MFCQSPGTHALFSQTAVQMRRKWRTGIQLVCRSLLPHCCANYWQRIISFDNYIGIEWWCLVTEHSCRMKRHWRLRIRLGCVYVWAVRYANRPSHRNMTMTFISLILNSKQFTNVCSFIPTFKSRNNVQNTMLTTSRGKTQTTKAFITPCVTWPHFVVLLTNSYFFLPIFHSTYFRNLK